MIYIINRYNFLKFVKIFLKKLKKFKKNIFLYNNIFSFPLYFNKKIKKIHLLTKKVDNLFGNEKKMYLLYDLKFGCYQYLYKVK